MKIPKNLYNKEQLETLKNNNVVFDFDKDYTDNELANFEDVIGNLMWNYGFDDCGEPTDKCAFWEKIFDDFQDNIINLI